MKKLLYCAAALAMAFFAGSCQQEKLEPVAGNGTVTFTVEAPANVQTRAIADGQNVDQLVYEVWLTPNIGTLDGGQKLYQAETEMVSDGTVNKATLTLDLVNDQKFAVLFWAQVDAADAYNTNDLTAVTYAKNEYMANDESLAAFYAVAYVDDCQHVNAAGSAVSSEVVLRRPFAQLNIGTLNTATDYTVSLVNSEVTVSKVNNIFNVATREASSDAPMTFHLAAVPSDPSTLNVNGVSYQYAGMNYMFAGDNVTVDYKIETKIIAENGSEITGNVTNTVSSVPLRENYRTNIVGNLLTSKVDYEIIVDERFNEPDTPLVSNGWAYESDYRYVVNGDAPKTSLAEILAHADKMATKTDGPVVTIDLNGDVYWETGAGIGSTPLLPETSLISAVVINGNGNTFTATGKGVGEICLANDGTLTFNDLKIVDNSVSYAENSWEYGYLEMQGKLVLNNCDVVNAIMIEGEEAVFNGCSFNSNHDNEYAVWVSNGKAYFNGCSFTGARGLKTHEAYGSEVVEIVVGGCWFGPLSKKPGVAIGTVNGDTKITIKNSKFSGCQAGDQKLYIYETDTDVNTFEFEQMDNEVFVDENKMLADAIAEAEAGLTVEIPVGEYSVSTYKAGVALKGIGNPENVVLNVADKKFGVNGDVIIENVTLVFSNANYTGFQHTDGEIYKNCIIIGQPFLYGNNVRFENCTFIQTSSDAYNVWTYGAKNVVFEGCTFNSAGKSVLVYHEASSFESVVTLNECTLNASVPVEGKAAIEIDGSLVKKFTVNINSTVANGFAAGSKSNSTLWNVKKGEDKTEVYVDGNKMYADGVGLEDGAYLLYDAAGMKWFANQVNENGNSFSGKTVKLAADIDLANVAWTPVGQTGATQFKGTFDGQNYMITNLDIDATAQTGANYSSGLFGWLNAAVVKNVKIDGASVTGNHNVGVIAGYLDTAGCTIENCHVANAEVECHVANNDANGDKCGVIVGHAGNAGVVVKDCTASDSTVSAGRDAGQIVGAAKAENVTGCSAANVTVTANGVGTGANVNNALIGRIL